MVGVTQVAVHGRPRCVVMSTGDEVVDPSAPSLRVGQVRDSNRVMLCALCEEAGGAVEVRLLWEDASASWPQQHRFLSRVFLCGRLLAILVVTSGHPKPLRTQTG